MSTVDQQTIDFYRQKLDEKQGQLNKVLMENKKLEMTSKREIKAAKIAEDNATYAFKEEKAKNEKVAKRIQEVEDLKRQADQRVERMAEEKLRVEGEKKAVQDRLNEQKEEFRRVQHLLPSADFKTRLLLSDDKMKGYQDLYLSLEEHIKEVSKLTQEIQLLKQTALTEIEIKNKVIEEIKGKKEQSERILKENLDKVSDLEATNATFRKEMGNLISDLEYKSQLADELARKVEEMGNDFKAMERKNEELEDKLQNEGRLRELHGEEVAKQEEMRFEQELEVMRQKYEDEQKQLLGSIQMIEDSSHEKIETLTKQKNKALNEANQLRQQLFDISQKLGRQKRTKEQEINKILVNYEQKQKQQNVLEETMSGLGNEKSKLQEEISSLKRSIKELELRNQESVEYNENNAMEWRRQSESLIGKIAELEDELEQAKEEYKGVIIENDRLIHELEEFDKQLAMKERERSSSLYKIEEHMKGGEGRERINTVESGREERSESQVSQVSEKGWMEEIAKLKEENGRLQGLEELRKDADQSLKDEITKLKEENARLQDLHKDSDQSLRDEITKLKEEITKLNESNNHLLQTNTQYSTSSLHLKQQISLLTTQLSSLKQSSTTTSSDNSNFQHQLKQLTLKYNLMQQELQAESNEYIQQIIKMKVKSAQSETLAEEKVFQYNKLKIKYDQLVAQGKST